MGSGRAQRVRRVSLKRETIFSTLRRTIDERVSARVERNAALPLEITEEGLVILRDGEPGEPDVTLNPRTEYYAHRATIEIYTNEDAGEKDMPLLTSLIGEVGAALKSDPTVGGLVEMMTPEAPDIITLAPEGAAPIVAATIAVTLEYLLTDPLL